MSAGVLTRKENCQGILAHLRAVGPQPAAEIKTSLGLTKRATEDAIWFLMSTNQIAYAGQGVPFAYKIVENAL